MIFLPVQSLRLTTLLATELLGYSDDPDRETTI